MAKWNYCGDINLEHGGFFWREDGADDYVRVVRVTPCSDAGGPDNLFQIETGSAYLGGEERWQDFLNCCGYKLTPENIEDPAGGLHKRGTKNFRRLLVESCVAAAGIDPDAMAGATVVRIGKPDTDFWNGIGWNPTPDVILRGNAKLRNYVRFHFLDGSRRGRDMMRKDA